MITRITPITELKLLYSEILLNKTNKITKIANESIVNGVAYGVAKVSQKSLKDIALIESHLFVDYAFGIHLDQVAQRSGISPRFPALGSSTFVRVVADSGTVYQTGVHFFKGQGLIFEIISDVIIGDEGYAYVPVRSVDVGSRTNINSLMINEVNPKPAGHQYVVNEYQAQGGRDIEDDNSFKLRIKQGPNIISQKTLSHLTQVLIKINPNILRVYPCGVNEQNQTVIAISTQNGAYLNVNELSQLQVSSAPYLNLSDYNGVTNSSINVQFINIEYYPIDITFRAQVLQSTSIDEIRKQIQIQMSKYLDFRFWKPGQSVEWDNLLQIVKSNPNIKYVSDSYFIPNNDILMDYTRVPRIRGFIILDLDGNLLIDNQNILDPVYYPNEISLAYQQTVL